MRDTIPWATRYLMALESSDIHGEGYEYCPESVGVIQHAPAEEQDVPLKQGKPCSRSTAQ
jgi:hypothetical protein